jgi:hypothetical protein
MVSFALFSKEINALPTNFAVAPNQYRHKHSLYFGNFRLARSLAGR